MFYFLNFKTHNAYVLNYQAITT